jgi:hypothetical protein
MNLGHKPDLLDGTKWSDMGHYYPQLVARTKIAPILFFAALYRVAAPVPYLALQLHCSPTATSHRRAILLRRAPILKRQGLR